MAGVRIVSAALNRNWYCSEKMISSSWYGTAYFRTETLLFDAITSIGSVSSTVVTVSGKNSKKSRVRLRITASSDRNPSRFL